MFNPTHNYEQAYVCKNYLTKAEERCAIDLKTYKFSEVARET